MSADQRTCAKRELGGPIIEPSGRVAGVVTWKFNQLKQLASRGTMPENIAFALRSSYALAFLRGAKVSPLIDNSTVPLTEKEIAKEAGHYTVLIGCFN